MTDVIVIKDVPATKRAMKNQLVVHVIKRVIVSHQDVVVTVVVMVILDVVAMKLAMDNLYHAALVMDAMPIRLVPVMVLVMADTKLVVYVILHVMRRPVYVMVPMEVFLAKLTNGGDLADLMAALNVMDILTRVHVIKLVIETPYLDVQLAIL